MKKVIFEIESADKIDTTIYKEMGVAPGLRSVMFFGCYYHFKGEKHRCFKGTVLTTDFKKEEFYQSNSELQQQKDSLYKTLVSQLADKLANYEELLDTLFDYMDCENVISDMIQKNPNIPFGCNLFIDTTDESANQLFVSSVESWARVSKSIQADYNLDLKKLN